MSLMASHGGAMLQRGGSGAGWRASGQPVFYLVMFVPFSSSFSLNFPFFLVLPCVFFWRSPAIQILTC